MKRIGVDVGGTFTDLILVDEEAGRITVDKVPSTPDDPSRGVVDGATIPFEVALPLKAHEMVKHVTEIPGNRGFYTSVFLYAMNKAKYDGLPADLKKVIDNNSGMATSGWLGKVQQSNDVPGRKAAVDRGNNITTMGTLEVGDFVKRSSQLDDEWVADMNKRGLPGEKLLRTAKDLIIKHGRA